MSGPGAGFCTRCRVASGVFALLGGSFLLTVLLAVVGCPSVLGAKVLLSEAKEGYIPASAEHVSSTWTFMLYFAGDKDLSPCLEQAIDRMEAVADKPNLAILVLHDGWLDNDTRLYRVKYDARSGIASERIDRPWNPGELNMGDSQTLIDFVNWARIAYPADHYFLSITGQGRGTSGLAWDETSSSQGDYLTSYHELGFALANATGGGVEALDVLLLDASLMSMLEVTYEVMDYVDYVIACENLALRTFAYDRYMALVGDSTQPVSLAIGTAEAFFDTGQLWPRTVSAVDASRLPILVSAVDTLAAALIPSDWGAFRRLVKVRAEVQVFDSYPPYDGPDPKGMTMSTSTIWPNASRSALRTT
jgi:hypothetical protein